MKRTISFVLVCILLSINISVNAKQLVEETTIKSTFTDAAKLDAKTWMSSYDYRALLACCLAFDYSLSDNKSTEFDLDILTNESYTGRRGFVVCCMYVSSDGKVLLIMYDTLAKKASYVIFGGSDTVVRSVHRTLTDGCYKNDVVDIYSIYQEFMDNLTSN